MEENVGSGRHVRQSNAHGSTQESLLQMLLLKKEVILPKEHMTVKSEVQVYEQIFIYHMNLTMLKINILIMRYGGLRYHHHISNHKKYMCVTNGNNVNYSCFGML
jgi:hypothetical protein